MVANKDEKMARDISSIICFLSRSGNKDLASKVLIATSDNGGMKEKELINYFKEEYGTSEKEIKRITDYFTKHGVLIKNLETKREKEVKRPRPRCTPDNKIVEGRSKEIIVTEKLYMPTKGWKKNASKLKEYLSNQKGYE